jgi:two-component system, NarL family, sensor histidine kinase UhpB
VKRDTPPERQIRARQRKLTIYQQIAISTGAILLTGALIGTLVTRYLVLQSISLEWIVLVSILGIGLSVLLASAAARTALQPLFDLQQLVRLAKEAQIGLDIRQLNSNDPHIRGLAHELNEIIAMLADSNAQLRALSKHAINAQEDERKRIARTLHDETGQALAMLLISLERIENRLGDEDEAFLKTVTAARHIARGALESLREIVAGLRPAILDDLGLVPAIRWYARTNLEAAGIRIDFEAPDEDPQLDPRLNTTIFRIVQESVNNIVRHSGARSATIRLVKIGQEIHLQVEDDGAGFIHHADGRQILEEGHWGLAGIQERAMLVNGTVDILSEPGSGTLIQIRVPIDRNGEYPDG